MSRFRFVTILLLIILGNAVVGVHASSHAQIETGQCDSCAAFGDPADAVPVAGVALPPMPKCLQPSDRGERAVSPVTIASAHPRGPPLEI